MTRKTLSFTISKVLQPGRCSLLVLIIDDDIDFVPGHSAVDSKVERIGETNEAVDEEGDVANKLVVEKIIFKTATVNKTVSKVHRITDAIEVKTI